MIAGQPQRQVTVSLGRPYPATDFPGEWCCRFEIDGLDAPVAEAARSLDAMGALLNAVAGIRTRLDESGLVLNLFPESDGDTGFPRYVPDFGDRDFTREIERYIDERMANYVEERKARRARRDPEA